MQQFLVAESDLKICCLGLLILCLNPDCQRILSYWEGWAIALASEGAARPLSRQFTNWLWDGILGVGDSGIASSGDVVNRNVFSSYGIAVWKSG